MEKKDKNYMNLKNQNKTGEGIMGENGMSENKINISQEKETEDVIDLIDNDILEEQINSDRTDLQSGSEKINKKNRIWMMAVIGIVAIIMGFSTSYALRQLNKSSGKSGQDLQVNAEVENSINDENGKNDSNSESAGNESDINNTEKNSQNENNTNESVANQTESNENVPNENSADENSSDENSSDKNDVDKKELNGVDDSSQTKSVRIVMVGDVLLHTPVSDSGLMEDGTYNYDHLFVNVKDEISAADLAIVNQEVILGGRELGLSGYPTFNGAYEVGDALVTAGFDVVLHATNHALDKGKTGILNCLNFWRTNYPEIGVIGINDSYEMQNEVYIKEVNGIKIAILNYTYGTNGISMPGDMPFAVNLIDREKIAKDMEIAREQADFIIVCPHWGIEYTHNENSEQRELAQYFAEQGADLIMGAHPHVIQPVSWVEASNGNRALVYYSLGNFINATSEYGSGVADRMIGAMADVTVETDETGNVMIVDYKAVPLVTQMLTGSGRITTYKLSDYNEELAGQNEVRERDAAFSYDYCVRVSGEVFGS